MVRLDDFFDFTEQTERQQSLIYAIIRKLSRFSLRDDKSGQFSTLT
jgi:hypothetical protein